MVFEKRNQSDNRGQQMNLNEGNQLNGVVRDINQIWSIVDFKNFYHSKSNQFQDDQIHINSSETTFSTSTTSKGIKSRIQNEFKFFSSEYFKNRSIGVINLFLSGHGNFGKLACS